MGAGENLPKLVELPVGVGIIGTGGIAVDVPGESERIERSDQNSRFYASEADVPSPLDCFKAFTSDVEVWLMLLDPNHSATESDPGFERRTGTHEHVQNQITGI